jgi:hypothetical protein
MKCCFYKCQVGGANRKEEGELCGVRRDNPRGRIRGCNGQIYYEHVDNGVLFSDEEECSPIFSAKWMGGTRGH